VFAPRHDDRRDAGLAGGNLKLQRVAGRHDQQRVRRKRHRLRAGDMQQPFAGEDVVDTGRVVTVQFEHESLADETLGQSQHPDLEQGDQFVEIGGGDAGRGDLRCGWHSYRDGGMITLRSTIVAYC